MGPEQRSSKDSYKIRPRLNVLFHGLIGLIESGDEYWALLPKAGNHEFKIGNPAENPDDPPSLTELRYGATYCLEGVKRAAVPSCRPSPNSSIVLSGENIKMVPGNVRTTIKVPKPHLIRGFRAVEARLLFHNIADDDATHRVLGISPDIFHLVVLFSYCDIDPDANIVFQCHGADNCGSVPVHPKNNIWNVCIYANMSPSMIEMMHKEDPRRMAKAHNDAFNDMFQIVSPTTGAVSKLALNVAAVGGGDMIHARSRSVPIADGPPTATPPWVGLDEIHFKSLSELEKGPHTENAGDPSGCTPPTFREP